MGNTMYTQAGKRALDIVVSVLALVLVLPVFLVVAVLVRTKLGAPIFFTQERPGKGGKSFRMIKFRTMTDARDADGNLLPDADRMTRFGALLRSTSLDELPELINVLKGDMSLIGPRPLLMRYLERYTEQQMRRHDVRPGITGWAQVNGRNSVEWEEKFAMDVWYVENHNLLLDIRILFVTAIKVLKREGISGEGQATASEFLGSRVKQLDIKRAVDAGLTMQVEAA